MNDKYGEVFANVAAVAVGIVLVACTCAVLIAATATFIRWAF